MKKVVVVGAGGRMGQEIIQVINESDLNFLDGVDVHGNWKSLSDINPAETSVVIDFSTPPSFVEACAWCKLNKIPLVSGTTGVNEEDKAKLKELATSQAVLWAANMSMGVTFVAELIKQLGVLEEDFDFQIEETHHRHKVDKPSGTAILLQEAFQSVLKKQLPEPLSIRGGGVFGIHKLMAMSEEETISIEHVALNRRVFAKGAVKAASWIIGQKAGSYQMKDVLGLE